MIPLFEWISFYEDKERERPVAYCRYCDTPLYEADDFYAVNGMTVCEECLPLLARETYRSFRVGGREWRRV